MSKRPTIPYPEGYTIKPYSVNEIGIVQFTDGTRTNVTANEEQCRQYGYKFDRTSGICYAWKPTTKLLDNVANSDNVVKGRDNQITSSLTTYVLGQGNQARNLSQNNMIVGSNNVVQVGIENGIVLGTKADVTTSGSLTIGGNQGVDNLGERQVIHCIYGAQTTSNSSISSGINNVDGIRFAIPDNSIIYFHADTIVVRTGGSNAAGAVGDYGSYVERGVIINKSGTCTIQRERDTIKTSGTVTNWRILAETAGTFGNVLQLSCRGQTNMILEWCMNVKITEIRTGVAL